MDLRAAVRGGCGLVWLLVGSAVAPGGAPQNLLYPDMFPFVEPDAPGSLQTLQNWQLSGTTIRFSTLFANQGDGLFEIRRGDDIDSERHELLQRVYIDEDFGSNFVDIPIGTAPIPGTPQNPNFDVPFPTDSNVLWFEDFTRFSLHEAPVVDGVLTVGDEVAGGTKTSWRLSANRGPLPGYGNPPSYGSPDQRVQQRISVGWADLYGAGSAGQSFDIAGVPVGPRYWLRQTVDPENRILETDETNNSFEVLIDLSNPGEVFMLGDDFVQPGDAAPGIPGDLTSDGVVNIDDWFAFKAGAETSLDGLSDADRLALGDLNLDGQHSLTDAVLFRQYFDEANGQGAFAALSSSTPEPTTLLLVGIGGVAAFVGRRRVRRVLIVGLGLVGFGTATGARVATARVVLFSEDFEGLNLGPNVDETVSNPNAWTDTPPAGWTVDDSGVPSVGDPNSGVTEWEGWSFADKNWWATVDDQGRSDFDLASGTVAVADADEWDDRGSPLSPFLGYYDAFMTTPAIPLGSAAPDSAKLTFASSWRDECCDDGPQDLNNQTALIRASYNGGAFTEVLRWESEAGPFFKDDATNEQVTIDLNNPAGATDVVLEFGLVDAGNDWWWAIDNVEVFAPSTLVVDVTTGEMTIDGAEQVIGYEITGPAGAFDADGWTAGNLDAQNYGSPQPMTTDYNNDGVIDAADYTLLRDAGAPPAEYDAWVAEFGSTVAAGESWETIIASDDQLFEFFLGGSSSFEGVSIGAGYDTQNDTRNLEFTYAVAGGQEITGGVRYVEPTILLAVPEAGGVTLGLVAFSLGSTASAGRRRA